MSVEVSDEDDEIIFCQVCKSETAMEDCDVCGACPGNVFCGKCCHEIDTEGKPTLLCGKCGACRNLLVLHVFDEAQQLRKLTQLQSVVVA